MTAPPTEPRMVVSAAIVDSLAKPTRLLAARRTEPPRLAGFWEFPGGKVEPGESLEEALHREIDEELGVRLRLGERLEGPLDGAWELTPAYRMHVWLAEITAGTPAALEDHDLIEWRAIGAARDLRWLPTNVQMISILEERYGAPLSP